MVDPVLSKVICIVSFVIEAHDCSCSKFLEDGQIILGCEHAVANAFPVLA